MAKPLYKLREGRIISGVCAGLAEYFNIDVNIVRICAVLIGCAGGAELSHILRLQCFCLRNKTILKTKTTAECKLSRGFFTS